jgi:hypothetical protein
MGRRKLVGQMVRGWVRFGFLTPDDTSLHGVPRRVVKSAKQYVKERGVDPSIFFRRVRGLLKIGG